MADDQDKKLEIEHDKTDAEPPDRARLRRHLDQSLLAQTETNRLLKDVRFALWMIGFVIVIGLNLHVPSCMNGL